MAVFAQDGDNLSTNVPFVKLMLFSFMANRIMQLYITN